MEEYSGEQQKIPILKNLDQRLITVNSLRAVKKTIMKRVANVIEALTSATING